MGDVVCEAVVEEVTDGEADTDAKCETKAVPVTDACGVFEGEGAFENETVLLVTGVYDPQLEAVCVELGKGLWENNGLTVTDKLPDVEEVDDELVELVGETKAVLVTDACGVFEGDGAFENDIVLLVTGVYDPQLEAVCVELERGLWENNGLTVTDKLPDAEGVDDVLMELVVVTMLVADWLADGDTVTPSEVVTDVEGFGDGYGLADNEPVTDDDSEGTFVEEA